MTYLLPQNKEWKVKSQINHRYENLFRNKKRAIMGFFFFFFGGRKKKAVDKLIIPSMMA